MQSVCRMRSCSEIAIDLELDVRGISQRLLSHNFELNCISYVLQDEAVLKELKAVDLELNFRGISQRLYSHCFELDCTATVNSDAALRDMHSSAEEFAATAERAYIPFQVLPLSAVLSLEHLSCMTFRPGRCTICVASVWMHFTLRHTS